MCGCIGYLKVGTRGVLAAHKVGVAGGIRRGSEALPRTPLWSRNNVGIVRIGSLWMTRSFGSQMVRWSMHVAWSGFDGGRNVGVE